MPESDDPKDLLQPARTGPGDPAAPARVLRSNELLAGEREVAIRHGSETCRLRLTATGKLILTK